MNIQTDRRKNRQELTQTELAESIFLYKYIACDHIRNGWTPLLLTFEFTDISNATESTCVRIMSSEIEEFYKKLLPHIVRKPRLHPCPILIGAPDMPVPKSQRTKVTGPIANEGLHFHAILLLPPKSRLKESLGTHIDRNWSKYRGHDSPIISIHVVTICETPLRAIDYVLKSVSRRRFDYETIILLPRAASEL